MSPRARPRLLVEERRRFILARLQKKETVTVEELARTLDVSSVTVRADLQTLADAGLLVRSHGGALRRLDEPPARAPSSPGPAVRQAEKGRIAARAAKLVRPGETVLLGPGSTTLEVARHLREGSARPLTVITNALPIAAELGRQPHVDLGLIVLGGLLRPASQALVGPHAEAALRELHADRAFIGVEGVDPDIGLLVPDLLEAQIVSLMMRVAKEVVLVADASKFGRRSLSVIGKLEGCRAVITDSALGDPWRTAVRGRGVELVLV